VLQSVTRFITRRMRLKGNADKSGVNHPVSSWVSSLPTPLKDRRSGSTERRSSA
jgi:hypothetical protein